MRVKKKNNPVNMTDVALRAGVSQSTVSRVINRNSAISQKTRNQVLETLREMGYKSEYVKLFSLDAAEKKNLDLVMCPLPEQKDPFALEYFSLLLQGACEVAKGTEYQIRTITIPADSDRIPEELGRNGAILVGYPSEKFRKNLREKNIPYVIASGDINVGNDEDLIAPNNFECGILGGSYLLERGCKRIGFMITKYNLVRFYGFQYVFRSHGLDILPSDLKIMKNSEIACFVESIHHWIAEKNLPDALVIGYSDSAEVVETILKLNGIRVPEDIVIMNFDHIPGKSGRPYLYTRPDEMGRRGVLRLLEKIRNPNDLACWIIAPMTLEGI